MARKTQSPPSPASVPADCPWDIVLGIDPGTLVLGYGAVVDARSGPRLLAAGVLRPPAKESVPRRLGVLRREMDTLLERLRPRAVVVECAFAARNVQSALRIGEGRGVILACAAAFGAEVVQYAPAEARKILLGNGNASKEQMSLMVATLLNLSEPPRPLDITDALSLALTYIHRGRARNALASRTSKPGFDP